MKNKASKQKSKRKGSENAFGCDLNEHLQTSGQEGTTFSLSLSSLSDLLSFRKDPYTILIDIKALSILCRLCVNYLYKPYIYSLSSIHTLCRVYVVLVQHRL